MHHPHGARAPCQAQPSSAPAGRWGCCLRVLGPCSRNSPPAGLLLTATPRSTGPPPPYRWGNRLRGAEASPGSREWGTSLYFKIRPTVTSSGPGPGLGEGNTEHTSHFRALLGPPHTGRPMAPRCPTYCSLLGAPGSPGPTVAPLCSAAGCFSVEDHLRREPLFQGAPRNGPSAAPSALPPEPARPQPLLGTA